jgi:phage terminase small subunit
MGRRGPAPTPTSLKVLRGTRPDRVNLNEPRPIEGRPVIPPAGLPPLAREEWDRVAPHLIAMGIVAEPDTAGLACYFEAVPLPGALRARAG